VTKMSDGKMEQHSPNQKTRYQ